MLPYVKLTFSFYLSLSLLHSFLSSIYILSQSNTARFESAGFIVVSVEPVNQSTDIGAIVGTVIGLTVIALVTVLCCWWMR